MTKGSHVRLCVLVILFATCASLQIQASPPKIDSKWVILTKAFNKNDSFGLRLQIRCSEKGKHYLNSADFYISFDSNYISFNREAVNSIDYKWAANFDPSINHIYHFSKVIDFGNNPDRNDNTHLMDIAIIDTSATNTGILLDSGKWIDVVDITFHMKKNARNAKSTSIIWEMKEEDHALLSVYESYDGLPVNFIKGEGWDIPLVIKLH